MKTPCIHRKYNQLLFHQPTLASRRAAFLCHPIDLRTATGGKCQFEIQMVILFKIMPEELRIISALASSTYRSLNKPNQLLNISPILAVFKHV